MNQSMNFCSATYNTWVEALNNVNSYGDKTYNAT